MILIELDRPRHLKFDMNSLSDADQRLNHELVDILRERPVVLDTARVLLWAGLKHEDPTLTVEQAGTLMDIWVKKGNTPIQLAEKISEGILESGVFGMLVGGEKNSKKPSKGMRK